MQFPARPKLEEEKWHPTQCIVPQQQCEPQPKAPAHTTVLKLYQADPSDAELQGLLARHPGIERLEIGSLRNITVVPAMFPGTLQTVVLHDVPHQRVAEFTEILSESGVQQVEIHACPQKLQEPQPQPRSQSSQSTDLDQRFRQSMIRVLKSRIPYPVIINEETTDKQLCRLYEKLPRPQKQGFWIKVGRNIGLTGHEALRRYSRMQRVLYPDPLTDEDK